jgi:hypothetical protein
MLPNRHPADELADVRAQIKALQVREAQLRACLLAGVDPNGADFIAQIAVSQRTMIDFEAVKRHFGLAALKPFMVAKTVRVIWLKAKNESTAA